MPAQPHKQKVVVLGGGPAAIAAAFELTDPDAEGLYEVTVLQPGWRLGGKCASGRNLQARRGKRIEEHGLHVWFGFYENALRLMRRAYDELKRPAGSPLASFEDAFKPCSETVLYDKQGEEWVALPMVAPENSLVPGAANQPPGFWDIAKWLSEWAMREFKAMPGASGGPRGGGGSASVAAGGSPPAVHEAFDGDGEAPQGIGLLEAAFALADRAQAQGTALLPREPEPVPGQPAAAPQANGAGAGEPVSGQPAAAPQANGAGTGTDDSGVDALAQALGTTSVEKAFAELLCRFRNWVWASSQMLFEDDPHWRLCFTTFDTVASAAAGVVEDGVLENGWEAINQYDLCEWLARHGAKQITLGKTPAERAPVLRSVYDVAFAYPEGKVENANAAAGTAMNDLLRLGFNYAGAIMFKMQAGMGDTVLTPFYEVLLRQRGVKFSFFSAVTALRLSEDHLRVQSVEYVEQLDMQGKEYEPTIDVNGLACWPSEPLWSRIPNGAQLEQLAPDFEGEADPLGRGADGLKRLELGTDFEQVVLGIGLGALRPICEEVCEHHPPFEQMLASGRTVRTQAFQLWLTETPQQLGWAQSQNSVAGCYVEPIDTWCDMTHLCAREQWPPQSGVKGIAYFCGVLDERNETPAEARARVELNASNFLANHIAPLWPKSLDYGSRAMNWNFLANPEQGEVVGPVRLGAQYFRANTRGSELYVLTPKGTVKDRLGAGDSGVENLYLAGDWTRNGIDGGCVEAAVASGVQAASALRGGKPDIVGQSDFWLSSPHPGRMAMGPLLASKPPGPGSPPHAPFTSRPSSVEPGGEPKPGGAKPPAPTTGGSREPA